MPKGVLSSYGDTFIKHGYAKCSFGYNMCMKD